MSTRHALSPRLTAAAALLGAALTASAGPYAPEHDQPGTTAIHGTSPLFATWAVEAVSYAPGPNERDDETFPFDPQWKDPSRALGPADALDPNSALSVVALGSGGSIVLRFDPPLADGPGADFAVFENGTTAWFLELAFVEVSSDGARFVRFPATSLTAGLVDPYTGSAWVDPTDLNNLASKYLAGYGTPFDLADLTGLDPAVDLGQIRYVRLVDIPGDGREQDAAGRPIYDPYPTVGSPGFDLDAVGAIHFHMPLEMVRSATETRLRFRAVTNRMYRVEWSPAMKPAEWTPLGEAVTGDDAWHEVVDASPAVSNRFYRLVRDLPPAP